MKVVILAGGLPSTISGMNEGLPKPMADIGGRPIIWHIMKTYAQYGFKDFIVCGGYKVNKIKEYFKDYYIYQSDITIDLATNDITIHNKVTEDWKVTIVDTGIHTTTGERIKQIKDLLVNEPFFVTYGDCLHNIDLDVMAKEHEKKDSFITMAVAKPTGRHSILKFNENDMLLNLKNTVQNESDTAWVNASCYLFSAGVLNVLSSVELNESFMMDLSEELPVHVYKHSGFWSPVETMRDSVYLNELWEKDNAAWKIWED